MTEEDPTALAAGVRDAWLNLAPPEKWRGQDTGWTATDLWALSGLLYETQPAAVVIAGGLAGGGLATYVGDILDLNKRGKVLASEEMSRERRRYMPDHRRVQYMDRDLLTRGVADEVQRFVAGAAPVIVLAHEARGDLHEVVTIGGYLVTERDPAIHQGFMVDHGRDPFGLSQHTWLMRVPV